MALAWRIAAEAKAYAADDLSGAGAAITGGRWNDAGTAIVYSSPSIALAALETLAHLSAGALPLNRYLVRIDIPDPVWARSLTLDADVGWDALPPGQTSVRHGEAWVRAGRSALLWVPSVIVPEERNLLINPNHVDSSGITAVKIRRFEYDARVRQ